MTRPNKVSDHESIIKSIGSISCDIVDMWLTCKGIDFSAGQFLMLEVPGFPLRRPFVIAGKDGDSIRVMFKIRGEGTRKLSKLAIGTKLKLLAPLGNPFPTPEEGKNVILVAGGMGAVTILPLAKELYKKHKIVMLLGAVSGDSLILSKELESLGNLLLSTDDGTCGEKCDVVELLKGYVNKNPGKYTIYSCGPSPMLNKITMFSKKNNMTCFISLEERMGCGVGACLCCAVRTSDGIKRVCKDGPVFRADEILWEEE